MPNGKIRRGGRKYQIRKITAYYHALNRCTRNVREIISDQGRLGPLAPVNFILEDRPYRLVPISVAPTRPNPEDLPENDPRRRAYTREPQEEVADCDARFVEEQRQQSRDAQSRCRDWVSKL